MREAGLVAQAKINVFLRVLARETTGYHSIETLFLRLELGDLVRVRIGGTERSLRCHGPTCPPGGLGPPDRNLAFRAAVAYADAVAWPSGFSIDVEKRIPVGGGLGGGSADAGAVLRALNALAPSPLGPTALQALAAPLGADVAFLASESVCALGWGRGERLLELPPPPQRHVELLVPGFAVSTQWAYERLASRVAGQPRPWMHRVADLSSWEHLVAIAVNDLEPVVTAQHPEIAGHVTTLRQRGARIAMMSGSGSTVFGVFDDPPAAADDPASVPAPDGAPAAAARLRTRTADRVVGVERIE
ncbi:MAG: 4-(cytidine 5'-diphospho)-2-C-methyl-D-erythritol kinase [Gemmatimonadaceae bacterium]